jgi:cell division protein ZapE
MILLPSQYYLQKQYQLGMQPDQQQWSVLQEFDQLYLSLVNKSIFNIFKKPSVGIYLWGSVGRGKTFLMDCFFMPLPFTKKRRIHFNHFMTEVHHSLNRFLGRKNPQRFVAKEIAKQIRVLCLDEFLVHDIADAMVLSGLLEALFAEGVCVVVTSNTPPDLLYKNGLQRQNFMPAIRLLNDNMKIIELCSACDYRMLQLSQHGIYHSPLNATSEAGMAKIFALYAGCHSSKAPLCILDREISVLGRDEEIVWFDFSVICGVPRSQSDYLILVQHFHTILISNIPVITDRNDITNFIHLIDILYDAKVLLIASAEAEPPALYPSGELLASYERTQSRLIEMQSAAYVEESSRQTQKKL